MQSTLRTVVALASCLLVSTFAFAEEPDFVTAIGTVGKFEKDTLTISTVDKNKKTISFKITGTSKFHLMAPQVRSGKTVITQRASEATDLTAGQSIAVIYTVVDKENVLLTAVTKSAEKAKDK